MYGRMNAPQLYMLRSTEFALAVGGVLEMKLGGKVLYTSW